jgi:hypothetical protein
MQTICVDFDGVIHEYSGWKGAEVFDGPIEGARDFLLTLSRKYKVVIFTTRRAALVREWLTQWAMVEFVTDVSDVKPPAVAYIDDRAVRFEGDFQKVLEEVERRPWWQKRSSNGGAM